MKKHIKHAKKGQTAHIMTRRAFKLIAKKQSYRTRSSAQRLFASQYFVLPTYNLRSKVGKVECFLKSKLLSYTIKVKKEKKFKKRDKPNRALKNQIFSVQKQITLNNLEVHIIPEQRTVKDESTIAQVPKQSQIVNRKNPQKQLQKWKPQYIKLSTYFSQKYFKYNQIGKHFPFQQFAKIQEYWRSQSTKQNNIKNLKLACVQKLTHNAFKSLDYEAWLNDDIVNIYLEMLQKRYSHTSNGSFKLVNSYFATNILPKDQDSIQRFINKQQIKSTDILIMPVIESGHWFFALFKSNQITIFDSIQCISKDYKKSSILQNALRFAKTFYGSDFKLSVFCDFPQQNNYSDCGVFMLMGIRDILESKQWSFNHEHIEFKRIQIACEILQEELLL